MHKSHTHYVEWILQYIAITGYDSYLELGVWIGTVFDRVPLTNKMGVDLVDRRGTKNDNQFFVGSTDDFFLQNKNTFDLIFIDASHRFENVKKDTDNSLKVLNPYGSILIHDTDPIAEFFGTGATEDSYKIVDYIQSIPELTSVTLPIGDVGLTICKRRNDRRMLYFI